MHPGVTKAKFPLGKCYGTTGALGLLMKHNLVADVFLRRHESGDWGDMGKADWNQNDSNLCHNGRVMSSYRMPDGEKLWVITEWDRETTTILLPDEY
jgi:hypothetical protein